MHYWRVTIHSMQCTTVWVGNTVDIRWVVGNPGNLPLDQVIFYEKINNLVSGKPSNCGSLWAMTNKPASGIGHTLSASACFRTQAHQNMQSLLGFASKINQHPGCTPQVQTPVSTVQVY
jgi:hypothetical protein